MVRVKRGVTQRRRHKRTLARAKGYRGQRSKLFREARQAVFKAGLYAYEHRRLKKRDFRGLWITRINAAVRSEGLSYSRFINALLKKHILIDRKILSYLATEHPAVFGEVVKLVRS